MVQRQAVAVRKVDLLVHRGLDEVVGAIGPGRQRAQRQARRIGQRAAVADDAVHADIQAASRRQRHVQLATQRHIARHHDQVVQRAADHVGLAERIVQRRAAAQRQIALDRQCAWRSNVIAGRQRAVARQRHVAANHALAAKGGIVDSRRAGRGRLVAVDIQAARANRGAASVGIGGRQDGGAVALLRDRARAADGPAQRIGIAAIDNQAAVVGHVADDAAGRGSTRASAQLQDARRDRGATSVGIVGGQDRGAVAHCVTPPEPLISPPKV